MTACRAADLGLDADLLDTDLPFRPSSVAWVTRYADSDWVDDQFAAIVAANWADGPGLMPRRVQIALAVRADRHKTGERPRLPGYLGRSRGQPVDPGWPRERSPPTPTGQELIGR